MTAGDRRVPAARLRDQSFVCTAAPTMAVTVLRSRPETSASWRREAPARCATRIMSSPMCASFVAPSALKPTTTRATPTIGPIVADCGPERTTCSIHPVDRGTSKQRHERAGSGPGLGVQRRARIRVASDPERRGHGRDATPPVRRGAARRRRAPGRSPTSGPAVRPQWPPTPGPPSALPAGAPRMP